MYPDLLFLCTGAVTKWIYGGTNLSNGNAPELQIWHQLGPNIYSKVGSTFVNSNTMIGTNLYEFVPQSPLEFKEGDILGIYVPRTSQALHEQIESGPANMHRIVNVRLSTLNGAMLTSSANNFPLVTAEISKI